MLKGFLATLFTPVLNIGYGQNAQLPTRLEMVHKGRLLELDENHS